MPTPLRSIPAVILILVLGALATGCATVPAPLAGDYAEFHPDQATERSTGARVRWGGTIVDTRPGPETTCIEILARDLDRNKRPRSTDQARGRFLACRDGFKDPAVFVDGREITVTGRLTGFVDGKIGEFEYRYPRVDTDVLYLWAPARDVVHHYYDPWWHSPWYPYYHPYRGPRTRVSGHVIIRR
ncbi:Slp family lipoprotein [Wenzhouxiangella sp. AB-CW3]|uniref:Slp family lipoprotein n=1 Tax=Wenzhouxiangella sp. AB-CW3 TaxID=2771012 RepID=UPI00168BB911|nr:Slp family lipoprotein [Wenzhouxiangella sp. AB-CW3]QOC21635.1 Slp family lipoprotein [Wenzhouxiangella sp. AB-CW3]